MPRAALPSLAGVRVAHTVDDLRAAVTRLRRGGRRVGLVPTMGALHAGHMSLVDLARGHADAVIVSIFVNPLQFGPKEDFGAYPRQLEIDCGLCHRHGVDLVYAPDRDEMYPPGFATCVDVEGVTARWCGASRPGHFRGVTTVVTKLLNAAMADVAVFGEKDWQQLQTLRRMALDLDHPTQIVGAPIAREADGLAMSSRNAYLQPDERRRATAIYRSLQAAQARLTAGEPSAAELEAGIRAAIGDAGGLVDYVGIVEPETLEPVARVAAPVRVLVAAWFGRARLLDNAALVPPAAD